MELYLNKKNDGISVDIDFDELIDQYGQQLIEAIAKRKKALEEISGLPDKDFPLLVIKEARTAASKENMQKVLLRCFPVYVLMWEKKSGRRWDMTIPSLMKHGQPMMRQRP